MRDDAPEFTRSGPTDHCGRMDRHDRHEWILSAHAGYAPTIQDCPGVITIEGGAECVTCQQPIANCEHSWRGQMRRWSE